MARINICVSCKKLREIRRSNGKCDSCYILEDYQSNKENKKAMLERARAWRKNNKRKLSEYNKKYYLRRKLDARED